jgi:hypothetical protein
MNLNLRRALIRTWIFGSLGYLVLTCWVDNDWVSELQYFTWYDYYGRLFVITVGVPFFVFALGAAGWWAFAALKRENSN